MTGSSPTDYEPKRMGSPTPGPIDPSRSELLSVVLGPTERLVCTIYPPDVAAPYRTTTWITASGSAFVDLEGMR
ncbi:hypothetical protein HALLA_03625 (plasmid) [Halostagnicola larsenii XH-48]|uniref:DUF7511 domain-containing protein n=1 Tax=Halostagnicola larsenii XH-48 TaxID=797299 RepID=W0JVZ5_9EURY|nr:hypothetical protein [Halostagnicola larsenii]AHG01492.1 hypothetical protein HALLA_03625 [Halostagnicola larsenii XH-48]